ncbi:MAG: hypothetical protein HY268_19155 [Deltaproteobacteria bacterium]|nr:hypothetical protein [Deltaproteobacteria bacterium]
MVGSGLGQGRAWATVVALQSDGKITAVGISEASFAVVRYNPDGSLDPTFGTQGKVTTQVSTDNTKATEE